MKFADLFLIHDNDSVHGRNKRPISVFTAPESLIAFPIATSVVATISRAAHTIGGMDSASLAVPLVSAFVLGSAMAAVSILDTRSRPGTRSEWIATLLVAATNSLVLFAAAVGVEKF